MKLKICAILISILLGFAGCGGIEENYNNNTDIMSGDYQLTSSVTKNEHGSLKKGAWKYYGPYDAASGAFKVVMSGSGDADLYVKKNGKVGKRSYNCRPYKNG